MFSANSSQVSEDRLYVEDVFSTYLYAGTGSTQTITNGIDLAGKGGLVWLKARNSAENNFLFDTNRGVQNRLVSNSTAQEFQLTDGLSAFNSNGFTLGSGYTANGSGLNLASWTFREAPKFFDVVTYTGNGANRNIAHSLGSVPGMILIKRTDTTSDWQVYHRSNANTQYMVLNSTAAVATGTTRWNSTTPTATEFTVGTDTTVNANGGTYVAYLFAHDTTSDGIIQCGSYTGAYPSSPTVTLGWEPQWVMIKGVTDGGVYSNWGIWDNMRGMPVGGNDPLLDANRTTEEGTTYTNTGDYISPTATGFIVDPAANGWNINNSTGYTYIYVAIRRGPMRTPTSGTSVFSVKNYLATTSSASVTHDVTFDAEVSANRDGVTSKFLFVDGLRGINGNVLVSSNTNAEASYPTYWSRKDQRTMSAVSAYDEWWAAGSGTRNHISYGLVRAPSFFDVVCYTGTGSNQTLNHNLGITPELMIFKSRNKGGAGRDWVVWHSSFTADNWMNLNTTGAKSTYSTAWPSLPTATTYSISGTALGIGDSGTTVVGYLFGSAPGVSKVGTYTGNGSSQTINCGFAAGARFVMIKRTDSTGDWYVWDTARGIVSGNDPHLSLNSTAGEVTTDDSVDTDSSGFVVNQLSATNINVSSATYIYLAVA